ncbi:uncharacterized protein [Nicotiana sylvestris]|uniref:Sister chromatid cohesion protein DCC1 n=2 Tax=Nicotiana TaxID=4085 RepID=A0A1S3XL71_TOBAC|nr:PREDICTED: sister chromatid cohesion protein DCC1 [Nicotiana sylvestris]XP_009758568.1 PREDICTED: sister chromatid cohesion protein DCC1 [Nicotiana sylvestris]XP_016440680.1 PREDICTED: sister chromatid cohesion protein DCC1-like [Nicotiana tabacum]XP_016440681.1 PREDICTED: sister chromatid cohesion protein DCC1-like [Nicotiana tabacum]
MDLKMEIEKSQTCAEGGAEAILNVQPNSSISIAYHNLFGPHDDLMLLELDEKLLPDILNQRVTLRGQPDEDAVLCSQSKTYAIKFVGTSNSVFLIPPPDLPITHGASPNSSEKHHDNLTVASVIKVVPGSLELVEVAPRLDKLKSLLSENPYGFDEVSQMDTEFAHKSRGLYAWDDLVEKVQASDEELCTGLRALSAVEIDGYWRLLDENFVDEILNMLLHDAVLNDWPLSALNEDEVLRVLEADGFPRKIVRHCLEVYGSKVDDDTRGGCTWRLEERLVCVHFARVILRGKKMKLERFMEEWRKKVPEGMNASFDVLEGEVLTEKLGIETRIYAFSVSSLPSVPAERFSKLFQEKPKWEWNELQPFVRDLKLPGLSLEGLLLKYTRRTQPSMDAEPIFSAR